MRTFLCGIILSVVYDASLAMASGESERLYDAAADGEIEVVRDFLNAGGSPDVIVTASKSRPRPRRATEQYTGPIVEVAILSGNEDIAMLLVEAGADLSSLPKLDGRTALFVAVQLGMRNLAALLIERDPSLLVQGSPDKSPLLGATSYGRYSLVSMMLSRGQNAGLDWGPALNIALRLALIDGHEDIARLLLKAGANPKDVLAFHNAVAGSNVGIVHDLLEAGASPTAPFEGKNPLYGIVYRVTVSSDPLSDQPRLILREFIDAGVDVCTYFKSLEDPAESVVELFQLAANCELSAVATEDQQDHRE
ncbi:MAG: ankyrin repeat domain-containing protein [Gammaproteobacteria bacterium]